MNYQRNFIYKIFRNIKEMDERPLHDFIPYENNLLTTRYCKIPAMTKTPPKICIGLSRSPAKKKPKTAANTGSVVSITAALTEEILC